MLYRLATGESFTTTAIHVPSLEEQRIADLEFERIARLNHFRLCPSCQSPIEKNGGCDNMSCRCGRAFRWSEARTLFPCHQLHLAARGGLSRFWGCTCPGCSNAAKVKLAVYRSTVVVVGAPIAVAGAVVAGICVGTSRAVQSSRDWIRTKWNCIPRGIHVADSPNIKLVVVGAGGIGKTSLLIRYTSNAYPEEYIPTCFDNYTANVMIDGIAANLSLWDTAGGEDYARLRPLSYPQTDVFLVCFTVTSRGSMATAENEFIPEIRHHCPGVRIILLGTRCDLRTDASTEAGPSGETVHYRRKNDNIPAEEGHALAQRTGCVKYMEASALTGENVTAVFDSCIRAARGADIIAELQRTRLQRFRRAITFKKSPLVVA